jgi:hypothetical protein
VLHHAQLWFSCLYKIPVNYPRAQSPESWSPLALASKGSHWTSFLHLDLHFLICQMEVAKDPPHTAASNAESLLCASLDVWYKWSLFTWPVLPALGTVQETRPLLTQHQDRTSPCPGAHAASLSLSEGQCLGNGMEDVSLETNERVLKCSYGGVDMAPISYVKPGSEGLGC